MRRLASVAVTVALSTACAQIIGLSDYEKVGGDEFGGNASTTGGKSGKGGASGNLGGSSSGHGGSSAVAGEGGAAEGGSETGTGGSVLTSGGKAGTGGKAGSGGVATVTGGKAGTGGVATVTGGKAGTGGASPPSGGAPTGGVTGTGGAGTCVPQTVDLFADNGNFDGAAIPFGQASSTGITGWYQGSRDGLAVIENTTQLAAYSITPRSAPNAAHLGEIGTYTFMDGFVGRDSWVGKLITLPASTSAISFSCYVFVDTEEPSSSDSFDWLDLALYDETVGKAAYVFDEYSNLDAKTYWQHTLVDVDPADVATLAGRSFSAEMYALVDDEFRTGFFVDSCSLQITYCQ